MSRVDVARTSLRCNMGEAAAGKICIRLRFDKEAGRSPWLVCSSAQS
jgi:hypothetical protein